MTRDFVYSFFIVFFPFVCRFAFLMTFLSRFSWSAVGMNFLICVLTIQVGAALKLLLKPPCEALPYTVGLVFTACAHWSLVGRL
jgi:hypothetical protein